MSVAKVLRLDEYRDRRTDRRRLAAALARQDPARHAVLLLLAEIAELCGADRSATVWVDEYGSGLIHPHVVLDLLSDRPRREFAPEPLREAWELGVPAAIDRPSSPTSRMSTTFAVSLGSDGTRAWFLVAESVASRPVLEPSVRDRIMFLAGECSAILLHRDLEAALDPRTDGTARFAGWAILEDLEGREPEDEESRHIARRFIVGRLARMLVEDDLAISPDKLAEQVQRARSELRPDVGVEACGDEARLWEAVLEGLERVDFDGVADALVRVGNAAEGKGHFNGAMELYRCAYEIAASIGVPQVAVEAARLSGRLLRRQAAWVDANAWYRRAHAVAEAGRLLQGAAEALIGLALIDKDRGSLPAAREGLLKALDAAERAGDRDTLAGVHQNLLGVDQAAGNLARGLEHGWIAVATYESETGRTRGMASLAGALTEYGDRAAAEDAWTVVAHTSKEQYYRVYAHDALAYLAALRGDPEAFEAQARACDALGWETGPRSAKAEILYYRGLSYRALGESTLARSWLERALAFAEEHSFNRVLFEAEEALGALRDRERQPHAPAPAAPPELRAGLRAMRRELAGVPE